MEHSLRLPCNHSFEYIYLYYEIIDKKKHRLKDSNAHIVEYITNKIFLIMKSTKSKKKVM